MTTPSILGVPRARPVVEIGLGVSWGTSGPAGVWDEGIWDDAGSLWGRSTPYWVDVTCHALDITTFVGHERHTDEWQVGTATITVRNDTGWADYPPTLPADPDDVYPLTLRPGRPLRVGVAVDGGAPRWLWAGYIDQTNPGYTPEQGDVVTIEAVDAKGEAGRQKLPKIDPTVGAGESVAARIGRILNALEWRSGFPWRDIAAEAWPTIATDLSGDGTGLLNRAAQAGGGAIFGDVDGGITFRNRDWQVWNVGTPPDAVIGEYEPVEYVDLVEDPADSGLYDLGAAVVEDPAGSGLFDLVDDDLYLHEDPAGTKLFGVAEAGPLVVCPSEWELSFAREDYPTRVTVGTRGVTATQTFTDIPSKDAYGVETMTVTNLETQNAVDVATLGQRWLKIRGIPTAPRVVAVTLDAATAANVVDVVTTVDPRIPSRYVCKHRRGPVEVFNRQMFATSVEHEIAPDSWFCRVGLDGAEVFAVGAEAGRWAPSIADGVWDTSTWSRRPVIDPALEEVA